MGSNSRDRRKSPKHRATTVCNPPPEESIHAKFGGSFHSLIGYSVFFHLHEAWSTNHFVTVSLHRRELIRAGTTLVLVELFDFKFVARGKVNVAAPKVSAPPKSSIAR